LVGWLLSYSDRQSVSQSVSQLVSVNVKFWSENLKERDHSEDLGLDGKTILECIFGKPSGFIINRELFD